MNYPFNDFRCIKQMVVVVIKKKNGEVYIGTNWCGNPQKECPRKDMETGEGYDKCNDICRQRGHAEVVALYNAKEIDLNGAVCYIIGHSYCCDNCKKALKERGVEDIRIME